MQCLSIFGPLPFTIYYLWSTYSWEVKLFHVRITHKTCICLQIVFKKQILYTVFLGHMFCYGKICQYLTAVALKNKACNIELVHWTFKWCRALQTSLPFLDDCTWITNCNNLLSVIRLVSCLNDYYMEFESSKFTCCFIFKKFFWN